MKIGQVDQNVQWSFEILNLAIFSAFRGCLEVFISEYQLLIMRWTSSNIKMELPCNHLTILIHHAYKSVRAFKQWAKYKKERKGTYTTRTHKSVIFHTQAKYLIMRCSSNLGIAVNIAYLMTSANCGCCRLKGGHCSVVHNLPFSHDLMVGITIYNKALSTDVLPWIHVLLSKLSFDRHGTHSVT